MRITRTSNEKVHRLAELGLLRGCTNTELAAAAALTCEYDAPAGRVLCREGTPGNECFVVVEGEVVVSIGGTEIARLGPDTIVGEMALLDGGLRVATVETSTPVRLLVLSRRELDDLIERVPRAARRMLGMVAARLRVADPALAGERRDTRVPAGM